MSVLGHKPSGIAAPGDGGNVITGKATPLTPQRNNTMIIATEEPLAPRGEARGPTGRESGTASQSFYPCVPYKIQERLF